LGAYGSNSRVITGEMATKAAGESMKIEALKPSSNTLIEFFSRTEIIFAPLAVILTGVLIYQVIADRRDEPTPAAAQATVVAAHAAPVVAMPAGPAPAVNAARPQPLQITQPLPVVMSRLIELWAPNFRLSADTNICRALRGERVECFKEHGKWADLAALNRPAILTLQTSDGVAHHVLLRQLDATQATLETAMGPLRYSRQELDTLWNGEFLVLWRPEINATVIGPDSRGDAVIWLRKRLAELNGKPVPAPLFAFFDKGLRDDVMQFQVRRGLEKSGVVRTRTLIALGDNQPDTPTLSGSNP
jgi:general secretion pathway protein A